MRRLLTLAWCFAREHCRAMLRARHPARWLFAAGIGAAILIASLIATSDAAAAIASQTLMKGQSTTLRLSYDIGDVAVTDPGVCDYLVGPERRSLYLNARGGGETTITLWDTKGAIQDEFTVRVVTTSLKEVLDRVRSLVGEIAGVRLEIRNGRVEVQGEVVDPEDFKGIESLARTDPRVRNRVRITPEMMETLAGEIRKVLDVPGLKVQAIRDRIVLSGVAFHAQDAARAFEIAKLYSPDVLNLIDVQERGRSVGEGNLIELDFHLMEVKRSALRQLGFSWSPGAFPEGGGATAAVGGGAGVFSSIADVGRSVLGFVLNFIPKLKLIRERGDGRVLEHPTFLVKSGEEASFFSGAEVPYYQGEEVHFKKVGVQITASPIEMQDGVDLKLSATLSSPSADIRGAVDTHTISTTAICPFGQSLVVGNIIRNGDVKMKNRTPRDIDSSSAIFQLILSKDFQSQRSEFLIFVTPRIVKAPTPAEAKLRAFIAMEEQMIRDRSKKEFEAFAREQGDEPKKAARTSRRRRGRRWR